MKNLSVSYIIILVICAVFVAALIGFATAGESAPTKPPLTTVQTLPAVPTTTVPTEPALTEPEDLITSNDDKMYGYWIRPNGQILEELELYARATIHDNGDGEQRITVMIKPPDSFYYSKIFLADYYLLNQHGMILDVPYYFTTPHISDGYRCILAVDPEKGFLLVDWDDGQDVRLVASADPRVDPDYLLEYFAEAIGIYGFDDE